MYQALPHGSHLSEAEMPLFSEEPKAVDMKEIEEIMCSLMHVLRDENATANALRKRFPARPVMVCEHVIPFSSYQRLLVLLKTVPPVSHFLSRQYVRGASRAVHPK